MGGNCIVYDCSISQKKGSTLFGFPKDPKLRREWTLQVKRTRDKWRGPSDYSAVCSEHFIQECFQVSASTAIKLRLKRKLRLKPRAVPSYHFPQTCIYQEAFSIFCLWKARAKGTLTSGVLEHKWRASLKLHY